MQAGFGDKLYASKPSPTKKIISNNSFSNNNGNINNTNNSNNNKQRKSSAIEIDDGLIDLYRRGVLIQAHQRNPDCFYVYSGDVHEAKKDPALNHALRKVGVLVWARYFRFFPFFTFFFFLFTCVLPSL